MPHRRGKPSNSAVVSWDSLIQNTKCVSWPFWSLSPPEFLQTVSCRVDRALSLCGLLFCRWSGLTHICLLSLIQLQQQDYPVAVCFPFEFFFFFSFAAHFPLPDFAPIKHSFFVCLLWSELSWPLPRLYSNDPPYKVMIKIKIIIQTYDCYFRRIYPPSWYKSPWKLLSFVISLAGRSLREYTIWGLHY